MCLGTNYRRGRAPSIPGNHALRSLLAMPALTTRAPAWPRCSQSMFRAVTPEGSVTLDGSTYLIGGLEQSLVRGEAFLAYANRSEFDLQSTSARGP